jgi:hypothetical protein
VIGLAVSALPLATVARVAVIAYGFGYGSCESLGLPWPPAPGRRWQVPQELMIAAAPRRRLLVWGTILGPGFLTRNLYAGFAALVLLVAGLGGGVKAGVLLAVLIGIGHGSGRALALLAAVARPLQDPMLMLMRSLRWRVLDGLMLLAVAGTVAGGMRLG